MNIDQKDYKNEEKQAKKQIEELRQKLHLWNHHYFDLDIPIVDDLVYDQELNKLKKLEKKYFYLFTLEENNASPTQIVGAKVDERFQKIKHSQPMLSLNKAYSLEELEKFAQKTIKIDENASFYVEPKIDGISISLHYKQGKFTQAVTRGDGTTGEDVSHNIENIDAKYVPKSINYFDDIEIRGEVFLDLESFKNMNLEQARLEKPLFLNPRNAAAGQLRRLDSKSNKLANLKVFVYQVVNPELHNLATVEESIQFLQTLGFNTNNLGQHKANIHQSYQLIEEIQEKFDVRGDWNGNALARSLSGGNQQKAVVGREILSEHKLLVVVQPTRGLDVGAINQIYDYLLEEKKKKKCILLISYELDEVFALADSIMVINKGKLSEKRSAKSMTREQIGILMGGVHND